nr:hypothetical protein [Mixta theicola]
MFQLSQSASQPVSQSASQPVSQSASQPVSQSASQSVILMRRSKGISLNTVMIITTIANFSDYISVAASLFSQETADIFFLLIGYLQRRTATEKNGRVKLKLCVAHHNATDKRQA